jgi:hypothetical protein
MILNITKHKGQGTVPNVSIEQELSEYGTCQLIKYIDSGFRLLLYTETELTLEQLEEIEQIVLNHEYENFEITEE